MTLIGLDIGTTGCKANLFDYEGRVLASASREYDILTPKPGWYEQDAEEVWLLAKECLREVAAHPSEPPVALALSVQGEAIAPVDRDGRALRPMLLGMDTRTKSENEKLSTWFGADALFERTGQPIHTINTLPKVLWLHEHEPEVFDKAWKFMLYEDFILFKLGRKAAISTCLASRTQMADLRRLDWDAELLGAVGLKPESLSPIVPSGQVVGAIAPEVARDLSLPSGLKLVTGGHDQACGALGAGIIRPGLAMVSTGTAEVIETAFSLGLKPQARPVLHPTLQAAGISVYAHVVQGLYLAMTLNHSGGLVLRWFRDRFGQEEMQRAEAGEGDAYDLLLRDAPASPARLFFLPHLSGSGTPHFDVDSKGAIIGLTVSTTKAEVALAILEGLTFELKSNLDVLVSAGVEFEELRAIGGGAKSARWLQLKADVSGLPVAIPAVTEAAGLGASMLAGKAVGVYQSLEEAVARTVQIKGRYTPGPAATLYQKRYELYRQIYPALRDLLHQV